MLGKPLQGPGVTLFDVLAATEYVTPAIEIIDARIEQFDRDTKAPRKVFDTITDFAANAGIVLGGRPVRPDATSTCAGSARCSTRTASSRRPGLAAGVLNHPATGVAWLANKIAPYGEQLDAGDVVLAGSFTRPDRRERGDSFHVDYGPLGALRLPLRLKRPDADSRQRLQAGARPSASRRSACGSASPTPTPPRSAPAPASTGC